MIHLEEAGKNDLGQIATMAEKIWMSYYTAFISVEQIRYMLHKFYSKEALIEQTEQGQIFHFIKDDENTLGFISLSRKGDCDFFIHKFYLYSEIQGQNTGTEVMKILNADFEKIIHSKKINIRLTVNRQNYKAINFYFKNGFRIESVEDFDIGNGYFMNDFVMLKKA